MSLFLHSIQAYYSCFVCYPGLLPAVLYLVFFPFVDTGFLGAQWSQEKSMGFGVRLHLNSSPQASSISLQFSHWETDSSILSLCLLICKRTKNVSHDDTLKRMLVAAQKGTQCQFSHPPSYFCQGLHFFLCLPPNYSKINQFWIK